MRLVLGGGRLNANVRTVIRTVFTCYGLAQNGSDVDIGAGAGAGVCVGKNRMADGCRGLQGCPSPSNE